MNGEVLDRLKRIGGEIEGLYTPFDPEAFKTIALEMVLEAKVRLLLDSWALEPVCEGPKIAGVRFVRKAGVRTITAQAFVDATGDGDLAAGAGAPFESGRADGEPGQPMTMMLRMGNEWLLSAGGVPGGGSGFGSPTARDRERFEQDVRNGLITGAERPVHQRLAVILR